MRMISRREFLGASAAAAGVLVPAVAAAAPLDGAGRPLPAAGVEATRAAAAYGAMGYAAPSPALADDLPFYW
jgi:phosphodiesterase/alkaline phosphatase D-like protein